MKILNVIASAAPAGGGPIEAIRQAGSALAGLGHSMEIACLDAPDAPWGTSSTLPVHALGPGVSGYGYTPRLNQWLSANSSAYDCVVVHGLWQYASFGTWRSLKRTETPYFVYTHGMLDPTFKRVFPVRHIKKSLYWPIAEYKVLRDARAVLFTCRREQELAHDSFRPFRCNASIVQYCVGSPPSETEANAHSFLNRFPHLKDQRILLFFSRIHPKKGCDALIEAFASVSNLDPNLHLVIAGPDSTGWKPELEALAARLNIAHRITWTGMLQGTDKWSALRAAEVFVLPTQQENFGIAIVEALACGTPVLITDRVNIAEEIQSDGAGLVGTPGVEATIKLLQSWLSLNSCERDQMRLAARRCFDRRYRSDQAARLLIDTLTSYGIRN